MIELKDDYKVQYLGRTVRDLEEGRKNGRQVVFDGIEVSVYSLLVIMFYPYLV
jgi:hypothetical protein